MIAVSILGTSPQLTKRKRRSHLCRWTTMVIAHLNFTEIHLQICFYMNRMYLLNLLQNVGYYTLVRYLYLLDQPERPHNLPYKRQSGAGFLFLMIRTGDLRFGRMKRKV